VISGNERNIAIGKHSSLIDKLEIDLSLRVGHRRKNTSDSYPRFVVKSSANASQDASAVDCGSTFLDAHKISTREQQDSWMKMGWSNQSTHGLTNRNGMDGRLFDVQ
jgi:hypothetical protein